MPKPGVIIQIPNIQDVIHVGDLLDDEQYANRIRRLRAQQQYTAVPDFLARIPEVINHIDDVQDFLQAALIAGKIFFPKLMAKAPQITMAALDASTVMNSVNNILGSVLSGRPPKRRAMDTLGASFTGRAVKTDQFTDYLTSALSPFPLILLLGQVSYNLTGIGFTLGALNQLTTDIFWGGLAFLGGARVTIVLPTPTPLQQKAWRVLEWMGWNNWALPLLSSDDCGMLITGYCSAMNIVTEAPIVPNGFGPIEQFGYTEYHWDRFRETYDVNFVQTQTPFVESLAGFPYYTVTDADDPFAQPLGLPVRWPWNPVADKQLTELLPAPPKDPKWVKYWHDKDANYLDWMMRFGPYAQPLDIALNRADMARETAEALRFEMEHSLYDYSRWYNNNTPLFKGLYRWEERLLAIAIEENIFPGVPRMDYNYCFCSEPYDPPSRLVSTIPTVEQIRIWLDRARYLWKNPGAPYWYWEPTTPQGVIWKQIPSPGRAGRGWALGAACYELWGARYMRPDATSPVAPYWANWQNGALPIGIQYSEPGIGLVGTSSALRQKLRFKLTPDNSWNSCLVEAPVPPPRCRYIVLPDGTFILRCDNQSA